MKSKNNTLAATDTPDSAAFVGSHLAGVESANAALANANAAVEQFDAGEEVAACAGGEALGEFRKKRQLLINARDAATIRVDVATRAKREAEANEAESRRVSDYDSAAAEHETSAAECKALAEEFRGKIANCLKRARHASAAVQAANLNLPAGREPLVFIERDTRLAGGYLFESSGLATIRRVATVFDPEFWVQVVPPPLPIAGLASAIRRAHELPKIPADPSPASAPKAIREISGHRLPRSTESKLVEEAGAWKPKTFLTTRSA